VNWLVIENIRPWDGRYEFDIENEEPTTREWSWIKRFSGYLPLTIQQGLEGGDPELFCAFAILALRRAGKIEPGDVQQVYDRLADVPFGATIRLEADEPVEEGDAGPPPENSNGSSSITGPDSRPSSDRSAAIPPASGIPASATSTSARPASVR
jgi:hypothetical protein